LLRAKKSRLGITGVCLVGRNFFDRLFGMSAVNGAIRQQVAIMNGGRRHGGGQDKTVLGIN